MSPPIPSRYRDRIPPALLAGLQLPLIVAPMFLVSSVELVLAACANGVIGAMPTGNARSPAIFDEWAQRIEAGRQALAGADRPAPAWAVNLITHTSNPRFDDDLATCVRHRVPLVITALGSPKRVVEAVHGYGGLVFADVNTPEYARKAAAAGVDGLVLVCSGAGGHTGPMAAPAFVAAVRQFWDGMIVVGGAIADGYGLRAAQTLSADFAYMGTRFIASAESNAVERYKQMVVDASFPDIIHTNAITGAWANKLRPSLVAAGLDPDNLTARGKFDLSNRERDVKAWKDLWSAGHAVGQTTAIEPAARIIATLKAEYRAALRHEAQDPWRRSLAGE
ncbi:MAG: nitronate monooxygenase [Burkholderiales bacterium]|nr:nitronate monooxygenase [Burkholderiales bacterium]